MRHVCQKLPATVHAANVAGRQPAPAKAARVNNTPDLQMLVDRLRPLGESAETLPACYALLDALPIDVREQVLDRLGWSKLFTM